MKLLFSPYHEPLPLPEGACGALVVEAPRAFRRLVADLRAQLDGAAGACVLSHEGRVLDMARCLELFVDFVPFPCNRRTLLARALGALERQAAVEPAQLHAALLPLTAYLLELCGEYGLTLEPEKLTVSGLLKLAGACIGEPRPRRARPGRRIRSAPSSAIWTSWRSWSGRSCSCSSTRAATLRRRSWPRS